MKAPVFVLVIVMYPVLPVRKDGATDGADEVVVVVVVVNGSVKSAYRLEKGAHTRVVC